MFTSLFKNKGETLKQSLGIIDGLFLLFLAISGNFLAETLGCQTQELLTNSIITKQIMTFFIIFFTIDYSDEAIEDPSLKIFKTALVWIFFLLFTKMDLKPTMVVFIILIIIYVSNSYKKYYEALFKEKKKPSKEESDKHEKQMKTMNQFQETLMGAVVIIILIGFFWYYQEKKVEYRGSFDFKKFIFGVVKCKGMK